MIAKTRKVTNINKGEQSNRCLQKEFLHSCSGINSLITLTVTRSLVKKNWIIF